MKKGDRNSTSGRTAAGWLLTATVLAIAATIAFLIAMLASSAGSEGDGYSYFRF